MICDQFHKLAWTFLIKSLDLMLASGNHIGVAGKPPFDQV